METVYHVLSFFQNSSCRPHFYFRYASPWRRLRTRGVLTASEPVAYRLVVLFTYLLFTLVYLYKVIRYVMWSEPGEGSHSLVRCYEPAHTCRRCWTSTLEPLCCTPLSEVPEHHHHHHHHHHIRILSSVVEIVGVQAEGLVGLQTHWTESGKTIIFHCSVFEKTCATSQKNVISHVFFGFSKKVKKRK